MYFRGVLWNIDNEEYGDRWMFALEEDATEELTIPEDLEGNYITIHYENGEVCKRSVA